MYVRMHTIRTALTQHLTCLKYSLVLNVYHIESQSLELKSRSILNLG